MGSVYSTCFMDSETFVGGGPWEYVVPAGFTAVIKDIIVSVSGVGASGAYGAPPITFSVNDPSATPIFMLTAGSLQNRLYYWEGREVLSEAEVLWVSLGGDLRPPFRVNGFLLTN